MTAITDVRPHPLAGCRRRHERDETCQPGCSCDCHRRSLVRGTYIPATEVEVVRTVDVDVLAEGERPDDELTQMEQLEKMTARNQKLLDKLTGDPERKLKADWEARSACGRENDPTWTWYDAYTWHVRNGSADGLEPF